MDLQMVEKRNWALVSFTTISTSTSFLEALITHTTIIVNSTYPTSFLGASTAGFGFSGSFLTATFLLFLEAGASSPESSKAAKKLLDCKSSNRASTDAGEKRVRKRWINQKFRLSYTLLLMCALTRILRSCYAPYWEKLSWWISLEENKSPAVKGS